MPVSALISYAEWKTLRGTYLEHIYTSTKFVKNLSTLFSDINFVANNGNTFPGHKILVHANCGYFESMFETVTLSATETELSLPSASSIPFSVIVQYIYGKPLKLDTKNIFTVLLLANEYLIMPLEQLCQHWIIQHLDKFRNLVEILELALTIGATILSSYIMWYIEVKSEDSNLLNLVKQSNVPDWVKQEVEQKLWPGEEYKKDMNFWKVVTCPGQDKNKDSKCTVQ